MKAFKWAPKVTLILVVLTPAISCKSKNREQVAEVKVSELDTTEENLSNFGPIANGMRCLFRSLAEGAGYSERQKSKLGITRANFNRDKVFQGLKVSSNFFDASIDEFSQFWRLCREYHWHSHCYL